MTGLLIFNLKKSLHCLICINIAPDQIRFFLFCFSTQKSCYFSYLSAKIYVVGTHLKHFADAFLMSTHNIFLWRNKKYKMLMPLVFGAMHKDSFLVL